MAGAYRMALARTKVTILAPGGAQLAEHTEVTATVRDGMARAKRYSQEVATMPVAELQQHTSRHYTVVGPDGTTWDVSKKCNCSGG